MPNFQVRHSRRLHHGQAKYPPLLANRHCRGFCWLNPSVVAAQTAANLNCSWCIGPGEAANNAVRWSSLNGEARIYLINQANDVNNAVALVDAHKAKTL